MTARAISEAIERAFRAAYLLTGSTDAAETAVSNGISVLQPGGDVEQALLRHTIEFVIRRDDFATSAKPPRELEFLMQLPPVLRHCFVLRVLLGIRSPVCAAILDVTLEQFERSLRAAFKQFAMSAAEQTGTTNRSKERVHP